MTHHFENVLYLFAHNANGAELKTVGEIDVDAIRKISLEQGIWTMVYPSLRKVCDAWKYQGEFFAGVSAGIARKEFTLKIVEKLEVAGIKCCLLKGTAISNLYADPECRISGDTDILIDKEQEREVEKILAENGYDVEKREKNDHHMKAYHKVGGLLEVHVDLYKRATGKMLFEAIKTNTEPWDKIEINEKTFSVLGVNDGLMQLTTHYIKHFVSGGGGVRQMMDLLLYIEAYKDRIDFDRYEKTLKNLRYDRLIDVVKTIGAKYFGFGYDIVYPELAEKILTDTEGGGIFGKATDKRTNFYDAFCEKRTKMSKNEFKMYMSAHNERSLLTRIIPKQRMLIEVYGYGYAKNKLLVPVAWINRFVDIVKRVCRQRKDNDKKKEFTQRMQLMQDLGMIDKE